MIIIASNFNQSGGWSMGDVNYDGNITIADFIDVAANFNQSLAASDVTPEPNAAADISISAESAAVPAAPTANRKSVKRKVILPVKRHRAHHHHTSASRSWLRGRQRRIERHQGSMNR